MRTVEETLQGLTVRKEHLMCPFCGALEPVHPGHGTPAATFIKALELAAGRHQQCKPGRQPVAK